MFTSTRSLHIAALTVLAAALGGCPGAAKVTRCDDVTCPAGQICVDGVCSSSSCVVTPCPEGFTCVNGACVPACSGAKACQGSLTCCKGGCVDLQRDPSHCGACNNSCGVYGDGCSGGTCRCGAFPSCVLGKICCSKRCADRTDAGACPSASSLPDLGPQPDLPPGPKPDGGPGPKKDGPAGPKKDGPVGPKKDGPGPKPDKHVPKPDTFVPPDSGPLCGDGKCNGKESCLSCPTDCGKCPCTPGQLDKSKQGCGPCMQRQRQRQCQPTGQWGPWGACSFYCTGKYYCVNNTCAPCWPGTTEQKACACGLRTKLCNASGQWGAWSSCVSSCNPGYSCISNRCGKYYTAYAGAGGGDCGYTYTGYKQYVFCQPGDYCSSTSQRPCRCRSCG